MQLLAGPFVIHAQLTGHIQTRYRVANQEVEKALPWKWGNHAGELRFCCHVVG